MIKKYITEQEFLNASPDVKAFIVHYMIKRGILLSMGDIEELHLAVSGSLHHDVNVRDEVLSEEFFNNVHANPESMEAWQGKERIDIKWFEIQEAIKKLLQNKERAEILKTQEPLNP